MVCLIIYPSSKRVAWKCLCEKERIVTDGFNIVLILNYGPVTSPLQKLIGVLILFDPLHLERDFTVSKFWGYGLENSTSLAIALRGKPRIKTNIYVVPVCFYTTRDPIFYSRPLAFPYDCAYYYFVFRCFFSTPNSILSSRNQHEQLFRRIILCWVSV